MAKALRLDLALLVVVVGSLVAGLGNFVSARHDAALAYILTEDQVVVMSGEEKTGTIPLKALTEASLSPDGLVTINVRHGQPLKIQQQPEGDPHLRAAVERAPRDRGAVLEVLRANGDVDFVILRGQ